MNQIHEQRLLSSAELDTIAGGRGGAGNDTLLGNRGNDIVLGQDGNDLLIVNNGDGSDFYQPNKLGLFTIDL